MKSADPVQAELRPYAVYALVRCYSCCYLTVLLWKLTSRCLNTERRIAWHKTRPIATHAACSVCLSVCPERDSCINGWIDRDTVWGVDSGGPTNHGRNPRNQPRARSTHGKGLFAGGYGYAQTCLRLNIFNLIRKGQQRCSLWLPVL